MQKRIIEKDRILIFWNNKYYVVNEPTFKLIDAFEKNIDIKLLSKESGYSKNELKYLYSEIEKKLLERKYYNKNLDLKAPIKIQWKITNKCNLKCKHCYLGELNNYELPLQKALKICENIINSNVMEVTISGGECLTYPNIEKIISNFVSNDIKVNVFTNGILLDTFLKKYECINKLKNIMFYVSVDGLKESHESIRGKNTFERVIKNIKLAVEKGYEVVTNTVITKINFKDIEKMIILLKSTGVKDVQLSNLIVQGNAQNDMKITLEEQLMLKDRLSELYRKHPEYGYIYYTEVPDEHDKRKIYTIENDRVKFLGFDNWKCTAGVARVTVDSDGKVYCCPFIKESYLGDLNNETIIDLWKSKNRFKFLKKLISHNTGRVCLAMKDNKKGKI